MTVKTYRFSRYRRDSTICPVWCVTPEDGLYLHTFFDVCPFSPSQRYLAVTRLPFQDREPMLGDKADVCAIDLQEETIETLYSTRSWGLQLGANLNWGRSDRYLYSNDVIGGKPVCVRIDRETKAHRAFAGPMYHISPDEASVVGFPLGLINLSQRGYGAPIYPDPAPESDDRQQGLWRTDLETNEVSLLLSLEKIRKNLPDASFYEGATLCLFHSKFNMQGTQIMQVVRGVFPDRRGKHPQLITFNSDGSELRSAVRRSVWKKDGNHPSWHPDGVHLIQNLNPDGAGIRFCQFERDGKGFQVLSKRCPGSGHPSISRDGRFILTDAKPKERLVRDSDEVPIRLIDVNADEEIQVCSVYTLGPGRGVLRIDPHPAWSRDYKRVCFNAAPDGSRQVFIADLSSILHGSD